MYKENRARTYKTRTGEMLDFTGAYIRRALQPRLRGQGWIDVRRTRPQAFTIVHCYSSQWNGRTVALPVAQIRSSGGTFHLYWRRSSGRWALYEAADDVPFAGGLQTCVREIDRDRWGCFWG
jgi:hypothetical protein